LKKIILYKHFISTLFYIKTFYVRNKMTND